MSKISEKGSTPMQRAYAMRVWGAKGSDKTAIARAVGYSSWVSRSATSKIEGTKGFQNAMLKLANDSNNLALSVLAEFKARGLKDFSNKDLVGALNAIGSAWSKFNGEEKRKTAETESGNRLRTIVLNRIENQTITTQPEDKPVDLDF